MGMMGPGETLEQARKRLNLCVEEAEKATKAVEILEVADDEAEERLP